MMKNFLPLEITNHRILIGTISDFKTGKNDEMEVLVYTE
jgi:hypothetical protein